MRKLSILCLALLLLFSCKTFMNEKDKTIFIGAETKVCQSGEMLKDCMLVKWEKNQNEYELFSNEIVGFKYEEGYIYKLKISKIKIENIPIDGSSIKYVLKKQIYKKKVSD